MRIRRAIALSGILIATQATAATQTVPGTANPNLAGRADGYSCCSGDSVPGQSPVAVTGFSSCDMLQIQASGSVLYFPGVPVGNNPDGDDSFSMTTYGDGISAPLNVRANALVGVFLGDDSPTGDPTPGSLDFGGGLDFSQLSPAVGQIFFIGDGRTTDTNAGQTNGAYQTFVVPPGATRLFYGTADGTGWYNNTGSFEVDTYLSPKSMGGICGDPVGPGGVLASDALYALKAAVKTVECDTCRCDADGSGKIAATDALRVLRVAVGDDVALLCPCCTVS